MFLTIWECCLCQNKWKIQRQSPFGITDEILTKDWLTVEKGRLSIRSGLHTSPTVIAKMLRLVWCSKIYKYFKWTVRLIAFRAREPNLHSKIGNFDFSCVSLDFFAWNHIVSNRYIYNIGCLEPFLPLLNHFEIRSFLDWNVRLILHCVLTLFRLDRSPLTLFFISRIAIIDSKVKAFHCPFFYLVFVK